MQRAFATTTFLATVVLAVTAHGQEATPTPQLWQGSVGLSFVATSGNSDTSTLGADFSLKREPAPWGWDIGASFMRAEQGGTVTVERYSLRGRGERELSSRWSLFAGASGEKDTFAGYDLRSILEGGGKYLAVDSERHRLSFDGGLTWTREDLASGGSVDSFGALLGLAYAWTIGDGASLTERLVAYPNFDESADWRAVSETALQTALSERLALKVAYLVRYDNEPIAGFDDTDTTSTVSLVVKF